MTTLNKISLITLLSVLILSFGLSDTFAQKKKKDKQPETNKLKVEVLDAESNQAVEDVKVVIAGKDLSKKTNDEGKLTFKELPAKTHTIKINAPGYKTWTKDVELTEDSWVTVQLKPAK